MRRCEGRADNGVNNLFQKFLTNEKGSETSTARRAPYGLGAPTAGDPLEAEDGECLRGWEVAANEGRRAIIG